MNVHMERPCNPALKTKTQYISGISCLVENFLITNASSYSSLPAIEESSPP